ncbi:DUF6702 family protein [Confluentibacter sediminis]|uniref:DUF6702 family protein n=1 Tax=Confluentibacter sediminis TaxID=2219045 RepID=UPI000DAC9329|nr:DUF6702 family protein [Confluentibacter sediminis]
MKFFKITFLVFALSFFAFTTMHKYYISVTQIEYVQEKQSVQIISRIFIDDLEELLRVEYDKTITLAEKNEPKSINDYIETYLKEKIKIKINDKEVNISFIGKEYDTDIVKCYMEIQGVKNIQSFEISNQVLFDFFNNQQNIIKTKINSKEKSVIQTIDKNDTVLKFN